MRRRIDVAKAREREKALGLAPGSTSGSKAAASVSKAALDGSSVRRSTMATPKGLSLAGSARMSSSTGGGASHLPGQDEEEEDLDELRRELQALYRHKVGAG